MAYSNPSDARQSRPPRRVFLHSFEIMASVGVYEVEQRYEQRIVVSIDLDVADTYDGVSEKLSEVLDYSEVAHQVEVLCQSRHFKLIETLAESIATQCLRDSRIRAATVRIEKPDVLPNCRSVGIEIRRERRAGED